MEFLLSLCYKISTISLIQILLLCRTELKDLASQHSEIAGVEPIGSTTRNRDILQIQLSTDMGTETSTSSQPKPHVVLLGGLEGDEPLGTEILMRLIRHLITGEEL